jgi:hypothetical protein
MTLAEEIAREHVAWARGAGRSLRQIMLEVGAAPPKRDVTYYDALQAVAQAWITLVMSDLIEVAA